MHRRTPCATPRRSRRTCSSSPTATRTAAPSASPPEAERTARETAVPAPPGYRLARCRLAAVADGGARRPRATRCRCDERARQEHPRRGRGLRDVPSLELRRLAARRTRGAGRLCAPRCAVHARIGSGPDRHWDAPWHDRARARLALAAAVRAHRAVVAAATRALERELPRLVPRELDLARRRVPLRLLLAPDHDGARRGPAKDVVGGGRSRLRRARA